MVGRFNARYSLVRSPFFAVAIGCWLSFVPSSRADGPVLVPLAPPALHPLTIPSLVIELSPEPPADGPALPYPSINPPALRTPSLDESARRPVLPILKAPATDQNRSQSTAPTKARKPLPNPGPESDESEFVTVRSRKRNKSGFIGQTPRLETQTPGPLLIREAPVASVPNDPFPNDPYPTRELDANTQPALLAPDQTNARPDTSVSISAFKRLIDEMVLSSVPSKYTNDDQWGKKKTVTAGVNLDMKGLFLRAKRTTKEVNHGTWKKFVIDRKSSAKPYSVQVSKLKMVNQRQFQFSAEYLIPISTQAQLLEFSRGIRLGSGGIDGQAIAQLTVNCTVDIESIPGTVTDESTIVMYPVVNSAKLKLAEFKPTKGSRFKGSTGRELARDAQRIVDQQLGKHQPELTDSLNRQLAAQGFRIPLNDLLNTRWGRMLAGSTNLDG